MIVRVQGGQSHTDKVISRSALSRILANRSCGAHGWSSGAQHRGDSHGGAGHGEAGVSTRRTRREGQEHRCGMYEGRRPELHGHTCPAQHSVAACRLNSQPHACITPLTHSPPHHSRILRNPHHHAPIVCQEQEYTRSRSRSVPGAGAGAGAGVYPRNVSRPLALMVTLTQTPPRLGYVCVHLSNTRACVCVVKARCPNPSPSPNPNSHRVRLARPSGPIAKYGGIVAIHDLQYGG